MIASFIVRDPCCRAERERGTSWKRRFDAEVVRVFRDREWRSDAQPIPRGLRDPHTYDWPRPGCRKIVGARGARYQVVIIGSYLRDTHRECRPAFPRQFAEFRPGQSNRVCLVPSAPHDNLQTLGQRIPGGRIDLFQILDQSLKIAKQVRLQHTIRVNCVACRLFQFKGQFEKNVNDILRIRIIRTSRRYTTYQQ
jgi:hypothetical protein